MLLCLQTHYCQDLCILHIQELKKLREKRIALLEEDMREAEAECQKVTNQLQKAEIALSENRRLFSTKFRLCEAESKTPMSSQENTKEAIGTPRTSKKDIKGDLSSSLPRFMTSTAASRQRQSAAEKEIVGRAISFRSGTRSSIQFSASQSVSYSDPRLKAILQNSNRKSRYAETNPLIRDSAKNNGSDRRVDPLPRSKLASSSDPNFSATLCRHRRRKSDFI